MDKTKHYNLSIPGPDDPVEIEVLGENFRTLDTQLHEEAESRKKADEGLRDYAVTGPSSSTDGHIPLFSGTNGRTLKESGRSFPLKTADISDGSVTEGKLADKSVGSDKIQTGSVTQGKIKDGAVTEGKLADKSVSENKLQAGSVSQGKIKDGAVTEGKIQNGAVTNTKLAENSVSSDKILDGHIREQELADKAVSADKIQAGAVTQPKIQDGAVTEGKIHDGAVTSAKLADSAVTSGKIADHVIQKSDLTEAVIEWIESKGISELLKRFNNGTAPAVTDMQLLYGNYRILAAHGTPSEYKYYLADVGNIEELETSDTLSVVAAINSVVRNLTDIARISDIRSAAKLGPNILCAQLLGYTVYCGSDSSYPYGAYASAGEFSDGNAFIIGDVSRTFDVGGRKSTIINYGLKPITVKWMYVDSSASYPSMQTQTSTVNVGQKFATGYSYSSPTGAGFTDVTITDCDIVEELKSKLNLN